MTTLAAATRGRGIPIDWNYPLMRNEDDSQVVEKLQSHRFGVRGLVSGGWVKPGSQHGKTVPIPPANTVFINRTQIGHLPTQGTAPATGLLGADKYGQDTSNHIVGMVWPGAAVLAGRSSPSGGLELVPRVCDEDVQFVRQLGAGAFGEVRLARLPNGELAAVKLAAAGKEGTIAIEAATHARLSHVNVVQLRSLVVSVHTGAVTGVAMDFCRGGTLASWIDWARVHAVPPLPLARRLDVLEQLLAALEHMHARGVCHLDVKPCNVMLSAADLSRPQLIRLADFGLSQQRGGAPMAGRYRGTLPYMAPEFARAARSVAHPAMDMWSVGVVMLALVTPRPPAAELSSLAIKTALRAGTLYATPPRCEPAWQALMQRCLSYDAAARPTAAAARATVRALQPFAEAAPPLDFATPQGKAGHAVAAPMQRSLNLPESLGLTSF